jgi:hypothetical protein
MPNTPRVFVEILWWFSLISSLGSGFKLHQLAAVLVQRGRLARGQPWRITITALIALNAALLVILDAELWAVRTVLH